MVKNRRLSALLFGCGIFLTACASTPAAHQTVWLTDTVRVPLWLPSALAATLEQTAQIEGHYGQQTYRFVTLTKADAQRVEMVFLNDFGTEVFSLSWDGQAVVTSSSFALPGLKAEYLIMDWQLVFLPVPVIADRLAPYGLSFSAQTQAGRTERDLNQGSRLLVKIVTENGLISYDNLLRGYGYTIRRQAE
jgi:hypothetical protein